VLPFLKLLIKVYPRRALGYVTRTEQLCYKTFAKTEEAAIIKASSGQGESPYRWLEPTSRKADSV
jgi:hypothetical protein